MRRIVFVLLAAAACGFSLRALAATARFDGVPTATGNGMTLLVAGRLAGLDPGSVMVNVRVTGTATVSCAANVDADDENDQGHPIPITETGLERASVQDGAVAFNINTILPAFASSAAAGCSTDQNTVNVKDVTFQSITIRVLQSGRTVARRSVTL